MAADTLTAENETECAESSGCNECSGRCLSEVGALDKSAPNGIPPVAEHAPPELISLISPPAAKIGLPPEQAPELAIAEAETEIDPNAPADLKALPALGSYQKTYATSLGNNDGKAIKLFKEFESQDKIRRLKAELIAISQGRVTDELCVRILGPARRSRFGSFSAWAKYALGFANSAAR